MKLKILQCEMLYIASPNTGCDQRRCRISSVCVCVANGAVCLCVSGNIISHLYLWFAMYVTHLTVLTLWDRCHESQIYSCLQNKGIYLYMTELVSL